MRTLRRARRGAYRFASLAGDVNAIARGPRPAARRFLVRKPIWRTVASLLRRVV